MNIIIIYGVIAIISLLLIVGYCSLIKDRDIWFVLMFISVFIINAGYLTMSLSDTIAEALLANRISYLGSVFLPLCMFMIIMNVCKVNYPKWVTCLLFVISIAVFVIAASAGYTDWYYSDVSIVFYDGAARLVKVYGPLHIVYHIYLFVYFASMATIIIVSVMNKKVFPIKHAILLLCAVFGNILIWLIEQGLDLEFEFLSISYIITEIFLLSLYCILQDYGIVVGDDVRGDFGQEHNQEIDLEILLKQNPQLTELTGRELEVLKLLLEDKLKRKEMAEELSVTEHTIKKHTAHIFSKLEVSDRKELRDKLGIR
ncbi:MAG: hypothetical protein IJA50_02875 [Firmicutes bacterium]|nr:hypothetical protein [Bacillota bacterium]